MSNEFDKLDRLAWKHFDCMLSDDEAGTLIAELSASDARLSRFVRHAVMHGQIREIFAEMSAYDEILQDGHLASMLHPQATGRESNRLSTEGKRGPMVRGLRRRFQPAIAASLAVCGTLVALYLGGMLKLPGANEVSGDLVASRGLVTDTDGTHKPAATVTGTVDCVWDESAGKPLYGEVLFEGQELKLKEGLAQLTFESGAKLLLQGPTTFQVKTEMRGELGEGKLSAVCPRRASGFALRTPSAEIIDIGTEFAVQVNPRGESEIHVLDGEVVTRAIDAEGEYVGEAIQITENSAVKFDVGASSATAVRYSGAKFIRELEPRLADAELPPLPVRHELALWLAADVLVKTDQANRVIAWRDILTGDNQSSEDALRPYADTGPKWIEDAIHGKPALRFDGRTFLVTTPLETTDEQSVFVVFALGNNAFPRNDNNGQILNYNGPPHRYIGENAHLGVLQIGDRGSKSGLLRAFVYGAAAGKPLHSGMTIGRKLDKREPVVLSYVYDREGAEAQLYYNSELQSKTTAALPAAITSRKVIGRHSKDGNFFRGDIAELLIFNAALDGESRSKVEEYLMQKYSINLPKT